MHLVETLFALINVFKQLLQNDILVKIQIKNLLRCYVLDLSTHKPIIHVTMGLLICL